jgi:hypothetical protein
VDCLGFSLLKKIFIFKYAGNRSGSYQKIWLNWVYFAVEMEISCCFLSKGDTQKNEPFFYAEPTIKKPNLSLKSKKALDSGI